MQAIGDRISHYLQRVKSIVYSEKVVMFVWVVGEEVGNFQARIPVVTRRGTLSEFKVLHGDEEMDLKAYPWEFLERRIRNETWIGFVAEHMGKIVGYTFISTKEMAVGGTKTVEFLLPARTVYFVRAFVHPKYRNMSVSKHLLSFKLGVVKALGVQRAFGAVSAANAPQIHNCLQTKGVIAGTITYFSTRLNNTAIVSRGIRKTGLKVKKVRGSDRAMNKLSPITGLGSSEWRRGSGWSTKDASN